MATQVSLLSGAVASAGSLLLQTNGTTTQATMDTSGNLGLGVTPSAWSAMTALQVKQASLVGYVNQAKLFANVYFDGSNYKYIASDYASELRQDGGAFKFFTAASGSAGGTISFTQAMTLDASGNLIVGGTTTFGGGAWWTKSFTVNGSTGSTSDAGVDIIGYRTGDGDVGGIGFLNAASSNARIATIYGERSGANNSGILGFHTMNAGTSAERARIDSSGNLLVGGTAVNARLYVKTSSTSSSDLGFLFQNSAGATLFGAYNNGALYADSMRSGAGTNAVKFSTATGQITYDTSSARYKDNIRDSIYGLSHVMQMRSTQFEYKDDGRSDVGLIAEELNPIIPELVGKNKEGEPDSVSYDRMVSVLVKAIQEQQAIITQLQADVAALKG